MVQRDNTYYLDRDWRGYHNENGALFLEKTCGLITRLHTCMIFGHNTKTGMMFGRLRKYEDATFYRKNAFVTFDSMYEDGRYVIFASAVVSLDAARPDDVDFAGLISPVISLRYVSLRDLRECSDFNCPSTYSRRISCSNRILRGPFPGNAGEGLLSADRKT